MYTSVICRVKCALPSGIGHDNVRSSDMLIVAILLKLVGTLQDMTRAVHASACQSDVRIAAHVPRVIDHRVNDHMIFADLLTAHYLVTTLVKLLRSF